MKSLPLSLITLKRDWHSGEIKLIAVALIIAISAVTTVNFFVDRLQQAIEIESGSAIGSDLLIESRTSLSSEFTEKAKQLELQTANTLSFRTMMFVDDNLQLAEVKAVEKPYPLRGQLMIGDSLFDQAVKTKIIPSSGTAWLDPQLAQALNMEVGDTIELGELTLKIEKILLLEPDRGNQVFNIAPRLMINLADTKGTGLLLPGSQIFYRLLFAGAHQDILSYKKWAKDHLPEKSKMISVDDRRSKLRSALDRARQFLTLAALTSVFLAGIGIAIAARQYALRHQSNSAIMRALGASQGLIIRIYTLVMVWLGLITGFTGGGIAWVAQLVLSHYSSQMLGSELPPASLVPIFTGVLTGLIALLGFALPPLLQLKSVSPSQVLRHDEVALRQNTYLSYLGAIVAIGALVPWQSGQQALILYLLIGSFFIASILTITLWLLIRGLRKFQAKKAGIGWSYGIANIARRATSSTIQVVALGLGILVMLLLTIVRTDLLMSWQAELAPDTPNYFMINIQPDELGKIDHIFDQHHLTKPQIYPNIQGRLIAINDEPVRSEQYKNHRAQHLAAHEFHLTWTHYLQKDNKIIAGRWWSKPEEMFDQFSVEEELAHTLHIHLGDELTFQINNQKVTAPVTSLRSVEWNSFNPNFFVIASPGLLDSYPSTYMTSFYLPKDKKSLLTDFVKIFPSVTILDVQALMEQLRIIIKKITLAVEFIFTFTVAAGFIVLFATIQATHRERRYESAVFKALGASRGTILCALMAEFMALGAIAGAIAALGAIVLGHFVSVHVLHMTYHFNGWLLIIGLLVGSIGVCIAGLIGTRSVINTPPLETLRL
ncbi:ABC transporter permease [Candidatus Nitrosacidococcus tergens]|uniref:ABC3 transporter permease C-terminal domain-containing protein n=1 Tax=Candidatus Nitrosacidococcus tergens TaxID=553981 RepID=A0A7G1Q8A3_9GAMM|nr:FtsX-like permease family protein [Candidatus Nitrosacidococcus tergens]CAB1275079.1 conserved membrane protein of unknown function [Candidatus Nitrosacidococcus tergens]